jgi:hypothetical protein
VDCGLLFPLFAFGCRSSFSCTLLQESHVSTHFTGSVDCRPRWRHVVSSVDGSLLTDFYTSFAAVARNGGLLCSVASGSEYGEYRHSSVLATCWLLLGVVPLRSLRGEPFRVSAIVRVDVSRPWLRVASLRSVSYGANHDECRQSLALSDVWPLPWVVPFGVLYCIWVAIILSVCLR